MTESLIVQLCGYWLTITINQNYVCRPEINEEKYKELKNCLDEVEKKYNNIKILTV